MGLYQILYTTTRFFKKYFSEILGGKYSWVHFLFFKPFFMHLNNNLFKTQSFLWKSYVILVRYTEHLPEHLPLFGIQGLHRTLPWQKEEDSNKNKPTSKILSFALIKTASSDGI